MSNKFSYKKIGFAVLALGLAAFAHYSIQHVRAQTVNGSDPLPACIKKSTSGRCGPYVTQVPDATNFQLFEGTYRGHAEGHGAFGPAGGKVGANGCISTSPSMWSGACWMLIDQGAEGNIGDGHLDFNQTVSTAGDMSTPFRYWIVEGYANDADFQTHQMTNVGRRVNINYFNSTSYSVQACQPFSLSWETEWAENVTLFWDGAVGTGSASVPDDYPGDTWSSCTVGTALFTLRAEGPSGSGTIGVERDIQVQITPGPVNPVPPPPNPNPVPNPIPTPTPVAPPNPTPPTSTSCVDNSSVVFLSPVPATLAPGQTVNFSVRVTDTGDTRWYHGSAYQFAQRSGLAVNPAIGWLPYQMHPGDPVDMPFSLTAPSTPGSYTLQMQMVHQAGWQYVKEDGNTCSAPASAVYFGQQALASFTVQNSGNILVNSVNQSGQPFNGSWSVSGPGCSPSCAGVGTTATYSNRQAGTYTLTPGNVPGYGAAVAPSATQNLGNGTITYTITYSLLSGTVRASNSLDGHTWEVRNSANAVVRSGVGTAVDTFPLTVGTYNFNIQNDPSFLESARVNGGTMDFPLPYSFTVFNGGNTTLLGYYSQPAPAAPSDVRLELSPCSDLRVSWQDNSAAPYQESGFAIYYRTAPNGADNLITTVGPLAGAGTRGTFTWATPPATPVWIGIASFIDYGPTRIFSSTAVSNTSYTAQSCYPDLTSSSKQIYQVNGGPFNPSSSGNDGDIITYRIAIQNNGTDRVQLTGIPDVLHPNQASEGSPIQVVRPPAGFNLRVDKNANGIYNEAGESGSITGTLPNLSVNVSGTKCTTSNNTGCGAATDPSCILAPAPLCNNWVILFDVQVKTSTQHLRTSVWNVANLNYTYGGNSGTQPLQSPTYLINSGGPKVPDFREISP